jgi:hypothetical protein
MAVLPAISRSWCTRANIPIPDNSSTRNVGNSFLWNLKECLLNTSVGGTLTGVRHANSVWTVVRSSDGAAAGATEDGIDRWGTPYNASKFVRNTTGNAHSWIILRNSYIGHDMIIACNANSDKAGRVAFTLSSTPFGAGSVTASPPITSSPSFAYGISSDAVGSSISLSEDVTSGATFYSHFIADDFGNFIYLYSKVGSGIFSGMVSLIQSVNAHVSDTFNRFAFGGTAVVSGKGTPSCANAARTTAGCTSRGPDNSAPTGGATCISAGGTSPLAENTGRSDSRSGEVRFVQVHVFSDSPLAYRGVLPDIYEVIGGVTGTSYPTIANQTWVSVGNYLFPFLSTQPIL